jgi:oxygen-dependent protoporphyrinogen oxidase
VLLRAFVGGSLQPELFQDDDATMVKNVRDELANLLGVTAQPFFSRLWRHPCSMPQYFVGHEARIKRIEEALNKLPTLALAGNPYHGVGISDCVRTGEEAADKVVNQLFSVTADLKTNPTS